jgi:hypothetical protein
MKGVLLKLDESHPEEPKFWDIFGPIRSELVRFYWCFSASPFMAVPLEWWDDPSATISIGPHDTSVALWRPQSLGKYANHFAEEFVCMWAVDDRFHDPVSLVRSFLQCGNDDKFIASHASFWLNYIDGTCWECFANSECTWTLEMLTEWASESRMFSAFATNSSNRAPAFDAAGLGWWYAD